MTGVFRISEAGTIALHAAVYLAANPDRICSAHEMAGALKVSEAHLVKVLQRLTRTGLVNPRRGPKGGFTLARPAADTALRDVYEAIEGKLQPADCLLKAKVCTGKDCILGGMVRNVNAEALAYLSATRLSDLAHAFNKPSIGRKP